MFRKNIACRRLKKISTFRKLSQAIWERPSDPSTLGFLEIDTTPVQKLLDRLNAEGGAKVTLTHVLTKVMAKTLEAHPHFNVLIRRNRLYLRNDIDIFVQVFTEENGRSDLSGAKIRDAHKKSLKEIAAELSVQAGGIRKGDDPNLKQSKSVVGIFSGRPLKWILRFLEWLTFDLNWSPKFLGLPPNPFGAVMITNVGMFGLKLGWAPLVPFSRTPVVVTVGEITDRPVAENGKVVIRPIVQMGYTVDHRIVDGYTAGHAAETIRRLLAFPGEYLT